MLTRSIVTTVCLPLPFTPLQIFIRELLLVEQFDAPPLSLKNLHRDAAVAAFPGVFWQDPGSDRGEIKDGHL